MLNADRAPYFATCPRCGEGGLERLRTHAFCVNCNYGEIWDSGEIVSIPDWVLQHLKRPKNNSESQIHFSPKTVRKIRSNTESESIAELPPSSDSVNIADAV